MRSGQIEETIHFAADAAAQLSYVLQQSDSARAISLTYQAQSVTVSIPSAAARDWAGGNQVGIYADVDVGICKLAVIVEKDFACLDATDRENIDSFPNPKKGTVC
jgi:hypothetical protein